MTGLTLAVLLALGANGPGVLKAEKAVFDRETGVLQFAFTFTNATDSAVYLDCQGPPRAAAKGGVLSLSFSNTQDTSEGGAEPPERVGPRQVFTAARKLYSKIPGRENPGIPLDPSSCSRLKIEMALYPERAEGEGAPYLREKGVLLAAPALALARKGKAPPPRPVRRTRTYVPAEPAPDDQ
jgi:hypothetical protein